MKIGSRILTWQAVAWLIPIGIYLYDGSFAGLPWGIIVTAVEVIYETIIYFQKKKRTR